jgi:hypothetical protein
MADWSKGFPFNYTVDGDTSATAVKSGCVDEVAKIYEHLNTLRANISDEVAVELYDGTLGSEWWTPRLADGTAPMTVGVRLASSLYDGYGVSRQGQTDTVLAKLEDSTKNVRDYPITEREFLRATEALGMGVPAGVIIMWYGDVTDLPKGWALCDGNNRTPNLVGQFPRGGAGEIFETGGTESVTVEASPLLEHTHAVNHELTGNAHSHTVTGELLQAGGSHTHTGTVNGGVNTNSVNHRHAITGSSPPVSRRGFLDGSVNDVPYRRASGVRFENAPASGNHTHPGVTTGVSVSTFNMSHAHDVVGTTSTAAEQTITLEGSTKAASKEGSVEYKIHPAYMALVYLMKL